MQPIRTRSLKFVTMLHANETSRTVREPSQTLCEAEETFFAKYRSLINHKNILACSLWLEDAS